MSYQATIWAQEQETGSATRKLVLMGLASFADKKGRTPRMRLAKVSQRIELGDRATRRAVEQLAGMGLLKVAEKPGRASAYFLQIERETPVVETGPTPVVETPVRETPVRETGVGQEQGEPRSQRPDTPVSRTGPTTLEHGLVTTLSSSTTSTVGESGDWECEWRDWVIDSLRACSVIVPLTAPASLPKWVRDNGIEWPRLQAPVEKVVERRSDGAAFDRFWPMVNSLADFQNKLAAIEGYIEREKGKSASGSLVSQYVEGDREAREEQLGEDDGWI